MIYNCNLCDSSHSQKNELINHIKSKKHLIHFNTEQQELTLSLIDYLSNDEKKPFLINSAGGTGKTFTVSNLLKYYKNVVALGPTHQSVNVLREEFKESKTIHSFFGWSDSVDEEGNDVNIWGEPSKIPKNSIFVFDEISMMNDDMFSLYNCYIKRKYKIILMGDKAQLPPINKGKTSLPKKCEKIISKTRFSLFFKEKAIIKNLKKNMRSSNESLNNYLNIIREETLKGNDFILNDNKELNEKFIKKIGLTDFIVLCYNNDDVDYFNKKIKQILNPENYNDEIVMGQKCIINKYYNKDLHTGFRFTIGSFQIQKMKLEPILVENNENKRKKISSIEVRFYNIITTCNLQLQKVLDEDISKFKQFYTDNKKYISCLKIKNKTPQELSVIKIKYQKMLKNLVRFHCNYKLNYATTVHKAQGKGFQNVIVYNKFNIFNSNPNTTKYTACSRSKKNIYISKNNGINRI